LRKIEFNFLSKVGCTQDLILIFHVSQLLLPAFVAIKEQLFGAIN